MSADLTCEVMGRLGVITLDRPKALNALNLEMVQELDALLEHWAMHPAVDAVLIRSASERAFCAGGDVRSIGILPEPEDREALGRAFFSTEYRVNHRIGTFPKPFIALMAGITMGGGLGISVLGSRRIVGETLRMAMPETVLGLFPDVGASWFLNRCPGTIGRYLALTGATLGAADALEAKLATHHVRVEHFDALVAALAGMASLDEASVDGVIEGYVAPIEDCTLAGRRPVIDKLFAGQDLDAVIRRVDEEVNGEEWMHVMQATIDRACPTSLRATWKRMLSGEEQTLQNVLTDDLRMAVRMVGREDFAEGVRAILIDKDHAPMWSPKTLDNVTAADIAALLKPLESMSK